MTITPSVDNYVLGKGIVYFSKKNSSGLYLGERDLGNTPSFNVDLGVTFVNYFSSTGGSTASDKNPYFDFSPRINFVLDEINKENLALLSLAEINEVNQSSGSVVNEEVIAYPGTRFSLDYRNIQSSSLVIKNNAETVVYVKGTDYQVYNTNKDGELGRIYVLPDGSISSGQTLKVSYSYDAITYQKLDVFEDTENEGFLHFVSDNVTGPEKEVLIWKVKLLPSSTLPLISNDWSNISFEGIIEEDRTNHADCPYMRIIY